MLERRAALNDGQGPDQSHQALTLAQELSRPYSLAYALNWAARLYLFRREWPAVQERAEAAITLSTEQGATFWLAFGLMLHGAALAAQGEIEEGIAQLHEGLDAHRNTRAELAVPYFLAHLAEAYAKGGQLEEGLSLLADALAVMEKTDERFREAELYRLKGKLLLNASQGDGSPNDQHDSLSAACFLKAIEIARRQRAKSLELRATVSLCRLWGAQNKKKEARHVLAEIYDWFTEGFDTPDLKEARALLDALA